MKTENNLSSAIANQVKEFKLPGSDPIDVEFICEQLIIRFNQSLGMYRPAVCRKIIHTLKQFKVNTSNLEDKLRIRINKFQDHE